jgi:hypothetical protein
VQQQQQQQQQPQQQNQVGLSHVIKQLAQQIATANQGTNATHVYQTLVQLANKLLRQQVKSRPFKKFVRYHHRLPNILLALSQSLAHFAQQVASSNSNVVQIV